MNVLLIGNGFDLYYKLPTKYSNFLHTAEYLMNHGYENAKTIGDILSQEELQNKDDFIKSCYDTHREVFDHVPIDLEKINEIVNIVKDNIWFSFFTQTYNKDVGWIDFEKEIAFVLSCFEKGLSQNNKRMVFKGNNRNASYVISFMNFLVDKIATKNDPTIENKLIVNDEYCIEYPLGSKCINVDKEKVISKLYEELIKFSRALKLYLLCFVESTFVFLHIDGTFDRLGIFIYADAVVTFNYTKTYEYLYHSKAILHVHGQLLDKIVLGINSDESDELHSIDTSFIQFKKYFQRTLFETDCEYLRWLSNVKKNNSKYILIIMGHSLDITDEDIIRELFDNAKEIYILYHNIEAKDSYISNIVKMFGREGFELLKREKSLTFISLDSPLNNLEEILKKKQTKSISTKVI